MNAEKVYAYKDMTVHYSVAGVPKRGAILFLHPAFADSRVFEKQVAFFQEEYLVITVDMPGHGGSRLRREQVDTGHMPDIAAGICRECGVSKVHLVGVSLGSLVVQGIAHVWPQLAASVTVVGGYSIHKDNGDILKAQKREILKWLWQMAVSFEALKRRMVLLSAATEEGQAVLAECVNGFTRRSFRGMGGMNRLFVKRDEPMAYPLLIITGEKDTPLALEAGRRLAALEPLATHKIIDNAGHCANIDEPEAFNAILAGFLARLE
jgi:pimeloyl-ACP methyl ester carboxylesterase